ncbi:MAG: hypothetical protein R2861_10250 [Desulfobacterales bacterium]
MLAKIFAQPRGAHMLIEYKGFAVCIIIANIFGLFQGHHAGDRTGVGEIRIIAIARALDKHHGFTSLPSDSPDNFAPGSNFLEFIIGDHIRQLAKARMIKLAFFGLIGPPAGLPESATPNFSPSGSRGQDVSAALIVFQKFGMKGFRIQFLAAFVLSFLRKRIRYVKRNPLTRLSWSP